MITYSIRRLSEFEKLFNRLARKAVKLGLSAPAFRVTGERQELADVYEICDRESRKVGTEMVVVNDIEITGLDPVRLDGWQFVAKLETAKDKENLIYAIPGTVVPDRFKTSGCTCEHCNVNRARNFTFVLVHSESGEYKQVGSTCLRDFLGCNTAEAVALMFAFYGEIVHDLDALRRAEMAGWEGGNAAHSLRGVVAQSLALQGVFGWLSKSKAYEQGGVSTAYRMRDKESLKSAPVTEENFAEADTIIEHFAGLTLEEQSENELAHNAHVIAHAGFCSDKSFGLAVALPVCYRMAMRKKAQAEAKAGLRASSNFIGTIGERIKGITAVVDRVLSWDTEFGTSYMTIMHDENGNVIVGKDLGADRGDRIRFTATVKEHTTYDGVKQTKVLRAAKIERLNEEAALAA